MKRLLWFAGVLMLFGVPVVAQQSDPVVMIVNGREIHKSEFEIASKKNSDLEDEYKMKFDDFLNSYVNYQLAVEEAYSQKLDTTADFQYQKSTYRSSIAVDYMKGESGRYDAYVDLLTSYLKQDVELNHVLIPFDKEYLFPTDSLAAYSEAQKVRMGIEKNGFDRSIDNTQGRDIVRDYSTLKGYVGWVAPGVFPAAVEDALYALPLGTISQPIRTTKGYHIVQVLKRRPAEGGRRVDHVYFAFSNIPPSKQEVDSVLGVVNKLLSTEDINFDVLCQSFSEAYKTGDKGCSFAPFGLNGELPMAMLTEAYRLENVGDVSRPVVSNVGVHLMRLARKIAVPEGDIMKAKVDQLITEKDRGFFMIKGNLQDLLKYYDFKLDDKVYKKLEKIAATVYPTDSLFVTKINNRNDVLAMIEDSVSVTVGQFADYLSLRANKKERDSYDKAMDEYLGNIPSDPFILSTEKLEWFLLRFSAQVLRKHVQGTLEIRFPEFKSKVNEFSGELLAYKVKEKEVYNKTNDEEGLISFFKNNKKNYEWDKPRFKGLMIVCPDKASYDRLKKSVDAAKTAKEARALVEEEIENHTQEVNPTIIESVWAEGDSRYVDEIYFNKKAADSVSEYVILKGKMQSKPQEMDDVRSEVQIDYRNYVEKEWIDSLKAKYKVVVNLDKLEVK